MQRLAASPACRALRSLAAHAGRRRCRACAPRLAAARRCSSSATMRSRSGSAATRSASCSWSRRRRMAEGADTLITSGGVQSNHARATARWPRGSACGCVLVANGAPPARPTANALLDGCSAPRSGTSRRARSARPAMDGRGRRAARARAPAVRDSARRLDAARRRGVRAGGRRAARRRSPRRTSSSSSTSSGGTQAGLVAGCRLHGLATRVIGISADDPSAAIDGRGPADPRGPRGAARLRGRTLCGRRHRGGRSLRRRRLRHPDTEHRPKRSSCARGARRCSSIRPTRPRRWPG